MTDLRPNPDPSASADAAKRPQLHIDSDWKAQAQAEKERLARLEAEKSRERETRGGPEEMPPPDFKSLVGMLASQALMGLGAYADEKGRVVVDLVGSRFAIDLLGMLEEKTKGNLNAEESKDLTSVLGELRPRFVQIATLVAQQGRAMNVGHAGQVGPADAGVAGRIDPLGGIPGGFGGASGGPSGGRTPIIETP